jgi:hypothetical protein
MSAVGSHNILLLRIRGVFIKRLDWDTRKSRESSQIAALCPAQYQYFFVLIECLAGKDQRGSLGFVSGKGTPFMQPGKSFIGQGATRLDLDGEQPVSMLNEEINSEMIKVSKRLPHNRWVIFCSVLGIPKSQDTRPTP